MKMTLKAARINAGLTQEQLAKKVGVAKKTVSTWETGKVRPKIDKVEAICSAVGTGYDDITWCN